MKATPLTIQAKKRAVVAALGALLADRRALEQYRHPLREAARQALIELREELPEGLDEWDARWQAHRLTWTPDSRDATDIQQWMEKWIDVSDSAWQPTGSINALHTVPEHVLTELKSRLAWNRS